MSLGHEWTGRAARCLVLLAFYSEACLAHALMSENEEIMGLLLGDAEGSEAGREHQNLKDEQGTVKQVRIWCSMTLSLDALEP